MTINVIIIDFHHHLGREFVIEMPSGSTMSDLENHMPTLNGLSYLAKENSFDGIRRVRNGLLCITNEELADKDDIMFVQVIEGG